MLTGLRLLSPFARPPFKAAAGGAITQVQKKTYASTANNTSHSVSPTSTPTSGNLLMLAVCADSTVTTPSGWTLSSGASTVSFVGLYLYWKISNGTESTISVTIGGSTSCAMEVFEYSGLTTGDKFASNSPGGSPTSVATGTTAATTAANEMIAAIEGHNVTGNTVTGWSNSLVQQDTIVTTGSATNVRLTTALKTVSATGTQTSTATFNSGTNSPSALIGTFK